MPHRRIKELAQVAKARPGKLRYGSGGIGSGNIVIRLNSEVVKILRAPDVEQRLTSDGAEVIGGTPEAFEKTLRAEMERLAKMVKATGARLD